MKRGENLQRLVYTLERAIHNDTNVQMASPQRFRDKLTGKSREHDIGITFNIQHHKFVVAIECRDRTRPISVPEVEAFKKKCDRTGIDKGIIVSSIGFADTALSVAEAEGIGCMSLSEAERFNWCQVPAIEHMTRRFVDGPFFHLECRQPFEGDVRDVQVYDGENQLMTPRMYQNIADQCLAHRSPEEAFEQDHKALEQPVGLTIENLGAPAFYLVDKDGQRFPLSRMIIRFTYRTERKLIPLSFHQYVDVAKGARVTSAAIAEIANGDATGKLILHEEPDGMISVSYVPQPRPAKAPSLAKS
jgi:hypothetical protein